MSDSLNIYIIALIVLNLAGSAALLMWSRKGNERMGETTGHVYDGIEEYNNPLPRWWLFLFWITLIFSAVYLYFYPGFGSVAGSLEWTSDKQWQAEVDRAEEKANAIFSAYAAVSVDELMKNDDAMETGRRLFLQYCAGCHGSNARGSKGYPNLVDGDWLYGDSEEAIQHTIRYGRMGIMPPFAAALGDQGMEEILAYLRSFQRGPSSLSAAGEQRFAQMCAACHGADAKGNTTLGAPNLTDNIWLYGGEKADVIETLTNGRRGQMPAHADFLTDERIHVLTAYVKSLAH